MESFTLLILSAYLSGSVPYGKIVGRAYGVDIQKRGSGNIGFANVRRVLGWRAGIATLIADILKGLAPTAIALLWFPPALSFAVGFAAIIGHVFPVWLRFRGGKGIATGLGVVLALQPLVGIIGAVSYVLGSLILKKSSSASLIGLGVVSVLGTALAPSMWYAYALLVVSACWTLRNNLRGKVPSYDI